MGTERHTLTELREKTRQKIHELKTGYSFNKDDLINDLTLLLGLLDQLIENQQSSLEEELNQILEQKTGEL